MQVKIAPVKIASILATYMYVKIYSYVYFMAHLTGAILIYVGKIGGHFDRIPTQI